MIPDGLIEGSDEFSVVFRVHEPPPVAVQHILVLHTTEVPVGAVYVLEFAGSVSHPHHRRATVGYIAKAIFAFLEHLLCPPAFGNIFGMADVVRRVPGSVAQNTDSVANPHGLPGTMNVSCLPFKNYAGLAFQTLPLSHDKVAVLRVKQAWPIGGQHFLFAVSHNLAEFRVDADEMKVGAGNREPERSMLEDFLE